MTKDTFQHKSGYTFPIGMESVCVVQSDNFLIEVTGNVSTIKSKITAVYNRKDKKILYWHES